jgi:hypothetical protein
MCMYNNDNVPVVCACGVCLWCVPVVCACGADGCGLTRLVCAGGVCLWCMPVVWRRAIRAARSGRPSRCRAATRSHRSKTAATPVSESRDAPSSRTSRTPTRACSSPHVTLPPTRTLTLTLTLSLTPTRACSSPHVRTASLHPSTTPHDRLTPNERCFGHLAFLPPLARCF